MQNHQFIKFIKYVEQVKKIKFINPNIFHNWGIKNIDELWSKIWDYTGIIGDKNDHQSISDSKKYIQDIRFFKKAKISYAENLIEKNQCQLSFICENLKTTTVKYEEIKKNTMILSEYLQKQGIGKNDTVISIAPNREQNVFFMLAALNIGAKWIAFDPKMQPEFFPEYIKTIKPKIIFTSDYYLFNAQFYDNCSNILNITKNHKNIEKIICFNYDDSKTTNFNDKRVVRYEKIINIKKYKTKYNKFDFNHEGFLTLKKSDLLVHNIGGTLIEHVKEHKLHLNLYPDDVVFHMNSNHETSWKWFASMMFSAKHIIMYDGSINSNFACAMFNKLKQEGVTTLGISGDYIEYLIEQEYFPMDNLPLASNILIDYYNEYIYDFIKNFITVRANITPVNICSDILGCISIPHYDLQNIIPVTLGADIKIIDDDGNLIEREIGNLACLTPLPSMPMRIIGDNKINEYYFNKTNQIWSNGDIIKIYGNKILKLYDSSL